MTAEVAALCLRNNYLQSLAISLAERGGLAELPGHVALMETLEARGLLNRDVEFLPSNDAIVARADRRASADPARAGGASSPMPRTRFEPTSWTRRCSTTPISARSSTATSRETLAETYPDAVSSHRLRREVIATVLANAMINRGGPAFVEDMVRRPAPTPGRSRAPTPRRATSTASPRSTPRSISSTARWLGDVQLELYAEVRKLVVKETLWFLRNTTRHRGLGTLIGRYAEGVAAVRQLIGRPVAEACGCCPRHPRERLRGCKGP